MPYKLQQSDDGWYVIVEGTGKRMSKNPLSHERALAQLRALYANDPDAKKEVSVTPTASYGHGPGGLFSTPGIGGRDVLPKPKRTWRGAKQRKNKKSEINVVKLSHINDNTSLNFLRTLYNLKENDLDTLVKTKEHILTSESSVGISVFKDAKGQYRWVTLSSNCFRDRDKEIVSLKSLIADVERADHDGDYGPMRWWHEKGWDIGDCDFNMMRGKILIESGTFRSPAVAERVKEHAKELGVSIAFFHPVTEPDSDGIFHNIKRFERSLLPSGRASNLFTKLLVKGETMAKKEEKEKALAELLGDTALVENIVAGAEKTEKTALESGVEFKEKKDIEAIADELIAGKKPEEKKEVDETEKGARGVVMHKPIDNKTPVKGEKLEEDSTEEKKPEEKKTKKVVMEKEPDVEYVEEDEDLKEDATGDKTTEADIPDVIGNMTPDEFAEILTTSLAEALAPYLRKLKEVSNTVDTVVPLVAKVQEEVNLVTASSTKEVATYKEEISTMQTKIDKLGDALLISVEKNKEYEKRLEELEISTPNAAKDFIASQSDSTTLKDANGNPVIMQPSADPFSQFMTNFVMPNQIPQPPIQPIIQQ